MSRNSARLKIVNDIIRRKIRKLRQSRRLSIKEVAAMCGIPSSSYASLESGVYGISLDNLYRILGALDADISEVWPVENIQGGEASENALYLKRVQEFRLTEIVSLSKAEGAALFCLREGKCTVLLEQHLSDFLIDRLILYLEDGRKYEPGLWFDHRAEDATYFLFLKATSCPRFVAELIRQYLVIWSQVFSD